MTTDEQNRAIGEWLGWKIFEHVVVTPGGHKYPSSQAPRYAADLNAMHEAEEKLSVTARVIYIRYLRDVCADNDIWHATAAQRAESFIRAISRWKDQ